jgi:hypothetical protein
MSAMRRIATESDLQPVQVQSVGGISAASASKSRGKAMKLARR